jgi:hypothetical protein
VRGVGGDRCRVGDLDDPPAVPLVDDRRPARDVRPALAEVRHHRTVSGPQHGGSHLGERGRLVTPVGPTVGELGLSRRRGDDHPTVPRRAELGVVGPCHGDAPQPGLDARLTALFERRRPPVQRSGLALHGAADVHAVLGAHPDDGRQVHLPRPADVHDAALPGPGAAVEEVQGPPLVHPLGQDEPVLGELDHSHLRRASGQGRQPVRRTGGRLDQADLRVAAVVGVAGAEDESVGRDPLVAVVLQRRRTAVAPGGAGRRQRVDPQRQGPVDVDAVDLGGRRVRGGSFGARQDRGDHERGCCQRPEAHGRADPSPGATYACPDDGPRVDVVRRGVRDCLAQRGTQLGAHGSTSWAWAGTSGAGVRSSPPCRAYAARSASSPRAVWLFTVPGRQPSVPATVSTLRSS